MTTTPGKLTLISILVVAATVVFGVIATGAERSRAQAAQAVRAQTEPLLVHAVHLYTALSDAEATATTTFLTGGLEPPTLRARYFHDLTQASRSLATLTTEVGGSPGARAAVVAISEQLPVYSGLIEDARANNLEGFPVGAAYLRRAAVQLSVKILPEAKSLLAIEAQRLGGDYGTGTSAAALVVLVVAVVLALGLLVVTQRYLTRISRRVFNVPVVAATVVLVAVSIWALLGLTGEQSSLATARRDSDAVEALSASQVLVSRAQSDQSLVLVNRGSDQTDLNDLIAVTQALSPNGSLWREVSALGRQTGTATSANRLAADLALYRAESRQITRFINGGRIPDAIDLSTSSGSSSVVERVSADFQRQFGVAQTRFKRNVANATSSVSGLSIAIPVLIVIAGALAVLGLRQRLGEYR